MNWILSALSPAKNESPNEAKLVANSNNLRSITNNDLIYASELHIDDRGVDLLVFTRIRDIVRKWMYPESYWTIQKVKQHILCDEYGTIVNDSRYINPISSLTGIYKCSLIQMLEIDSVNLHPDLGVSYYDVVRKANVYISFAYTMNYFTLVETLELFANDKTDVSFWFEPFNINFWDYDVENKNILKVKNLISNVDTLLSCIDSWDNPSVRKRIWMIFELYCASVANIKVEFVCSRADIEYFKLNCDSISILEIIDTSILDAYNPQDKLNISAFFKRVGTKNTKTVLKDTMKKAIKLIRSDLKVDKKKNRVAETEIVVSVPIQQKYQNVIKLNKAIKSEKIISLEPLNPSQYHHEQIEKIHKLYEESA